MAFPRDVHPFPAMRLAASLQRLLLGVSLGLCMGSVPARALEVLGIELTLGRNGVPNQTR